MRYWKSDDTSFNFIRISTDNCVFDDVRSSISVQNFWVWRRSLAWSFCYHIPIAGPAKVTAENVTNPGKVDQIEEKNMLTLQSPKSKLQMARGRWDWVLLNCWWRMCRCKYLARLESRLQLHAMLIAIIYHRIAYLSCQTRFGEFSIKKRFCMCTSLKSLFSSTLGKSMLKGDGQYNAKLCRRLFLHCNKWVSEA